MKSRGDKGHMAYWRLASLSGLALMAAFSVYVVAGRVGKTSGDIGPGPANRDGVSGAGVAIEDGEGGRGGNRVSAEAQETPTTIVELLYNGVAVRGEALRGVRITLLSTSGEELEALASRDAQWSAAIAPEHVSGIHVTGGAYIAEREVRLGEELVGPVLRVEIGYHWELRILYVVDGEPIAHGIRPLGAAATPFSMAFREPVGGAISNARTGQCGTYRHLSAGRGVLEVAVPPPVYVACAFGGNVLCVERVEGDREDEIVFDLGSGGAFEALFGTVEFVVQLEGAGGGGACGYALCQQRAIGAGLPALLPAVVEEPVVVSGVPPGKALLVVSAPGYMPGIVEVEMVPGGTFDAGIIELTERKVVEGTIYDPEGRVLECDVLVRDPVIGGVLARGRYLERAGERFAVLIGGTGKVAFCPQGEGVASNPTLMYVNEALEQQPLSLIARKGVLVECDMPDVLVFPLDTALRVRDSFGHVVHLQSVSEGSMCTMYLGEGTYLFELVGPSGDIVEAVDVDVTLPGTRTSFR